MCVRVCVCGVRVYVCGKREREILELAHTVSRTGKSDIFKASWHRKLKQISVLRGLSRIVSSSGNLGVSSEGLQLMIGEAHPHYGWCFIQSVLIVHVNHI